MKHYKAVFVLQEWRLHEHIEITKQSIVQEFTSSSQKHPCISVTCRAARRPGYFYWNVFLIMVRQFPQNHSIILFYLNSIKLLSTNWHLRCS